MKNNQNHDLTERLTKFSLDVLWISERLPKEYASQFYAKQLLRSGSSPAFQYAEASAAESRKDFIHKLKIGLKELRETMICLTIITKKPLLDHPYVLTVIKECDELIAIFSASVNTARRNMKKVAS